MKRIIFFIFCITLFLNTSSFSQSAPFKWGKFSPSQYKLTSTPLDSTANAVVLGSYCIIKVDYKSIVIETHTRIKILNKNGFDKATISLPYYNKDNVEKITTIKAQTINMGPGGKPEKIAVEKDQIFTVDINDRWKAKKFTFPALKEGSIIEYKFNKVSKNYYYLDDWNFQQDIPVLYSELRVTFPKELEYSSFMSGRRLIGKYKNKPTNDFVLTNVPPIKEQPFVYNMDDYAEKIGFQLVSYMKQKNDFGGGIEKVDVLNDWKSLVKEVVDDEKYKSFARQGKYFESIVHSLQLSDASPVKKFEKLYDFVNTSFRWNGKNSIFNSQTFNKFTDNKSGNTADKNLFLVQLAKAAGLKCYPLLISTRSHGMAIKSYPLLSQFNRMVAYVTLPNGSFVVNANDALRPYNLPSIQDYVPDGFMIEGEQSKWIHLNNNHKSRLMNLINVHFTDEGKAAYEVSSNYYDYEAFQMRKGIKKKQNNYIFDQIKNKNITHPDSVDIKHLKDISFPLQVKYAFVSDDSKILNDNIIYFDPFIFDEFQENPFTEKRRYLPIQFPYERNFSVIINVQIPEGFEVVGMPKSEVFKLPGDKAIFSFKSRFYLDHVNMNMKVSFAKHDFPPNYNDNLKEFFDIMMEKLNEQLVMKRKVS